MLLRLFIYMWILYSIKTIHLYGTSVKLERCIVLYSNRHTHTLSHTTIASVCVYTELRVTWIGVRDSVRCAVYTV